MDRNQERYHYTTKTPQVYKDSTARTWQIDRATSEAINALASGLETWPSDLVNMLLQRGLDALGSGQWSIERRPIKYLLTWGQEESNGNQEGLKRD